MKLEVPGGAGSSVRVPGQRLRFATKVFGLQRGAAITPHGHRNMVSMHTVLRGQVRLRPFDRLADEGTAPDQGHGDGLSKPGGNLMLRPAVDRLAGPGDASTISSQRDNVHWFVVQGGAAYTFDCILGDLDPAKGYSFAIDLCDPERAERLAGGRLRAPVISWDESIARFGQS